jgi:hypothetical protein
VAIDEVASELVRLLHLLAAPGRAQRAYLESLGTWSSLDELALEFDEDAELYLQDPAATGPARDTINELDRLFASMADDAEAWDGEALTSDERWATVRELAARALAGLPAAVAS